MVSKLGVDDDFAAPSSEKPNERIEISSEAVAGLALDVHDGGVVFAVQAEVQATDLTQLPGQVPMIVHDAVLRGLFPGMSGRRQATFPTDDSYNSPSAEGRSVAAGLPFFSRRWAQLYDPWCQLC